MLPSLSRKGEIVGSVRLLATVGSCVLVLVACADNGSVDQYSSSELLAGIQLRTVHDPDRLTEYAEVTLTETGPAIGAVDIGRSPADTRFDVTLTYQTGGCRGLPEITVIQSSDGLVVGIRQVEAGGDCALAPLFEQIGIDLASEFERLPLEAHVD